MSWMMRQSSRASPGASTALLILMTRPSICVTTPSSSSCSEPGKDDVGMPGRLVEEEIDGDVELQFLQHPLDEVAVRQRHLGVEADAEQAADFAAVDLAEDLVGVHAAVRQFRRIDAPHLGDVGAVLRVLDVAAAGQLIALLAVFASALAVALAGDGGVAAALAADAAGRQHHVDGAETVLDAVRVMLDAAGVQEEAASAPCPTTRRPAGSSARRCPSPRRCAAASIRWTCSATFSKPTVCSAMKSWSSQSFSIIRCRMPLNRAMSRPGLTGRNRSQVRATGVMRGSTMMTLAPCSRACQM